MNTGGAKASGPHGHKCSGDELHSTARLHTMQCNWLHSLRQTSHTCTVTTLSNYSPSSNLHNCYYACRGSQHAKSYHWNKSTSYDACCAHVFVRL